MAPLDKMEDQFAILPIKMPPLPSYPATTIHEVRIRRNAPTIPTVDDSRSLFLKNVPTDSSEQHFRAVFSHLVGPGRFEAITFENEKPNHFSVDPAQAAKMNVLLKKRKRSDIEDEENARDEEAARLPDIWIRRVQRSSSTAIVLLADEKSVQTVLKAIAKVHKSKKYPVWGANVATDLPPLGATWISSHLRLSRADKVATQSSVHAFFNTFNRKEKEARETAKRLRNEPDEDGFVTVTRGSSRAAPASRNRAEEAKQRMVDRESKKKDETHDFYRFQLRERRKAEQAALVKRFEEDKMKVNAMRDKRGKFKPES